MCTVEDCEMIVYTEECSLCLARSVASKSSLSDLPVF
jgi:hypothetical protein